MRKLDSNIPNKIKKEINKIRQLPKDKIIKYLTKSTNFSRAGYFSTVYIYKKVNLAVKINNIVYDPGYLTYAKIAKNKYATNYLYPKIYYIHNNFVFLEKLTGICDNTSFDLAQDVSYRLKTAFFNKLTYQEQEIRTDLEYIINTHKYEYYYDVSRYNILFRTVNNILQPVVVDPIGSREPC